jgi:hypothetical protein
VEGSINAVRRTTVPLSVGTAAFIPSRQVRRGKRNSARMECQPPHGHRPLGHRPNTHPYPRTTPWQTRHRTPDVMNQAMQLPC